VIIQEQLQENVRRKSKLAEKIEETTDQFKNEELELRQELQRVKKKVLMIFNHREKVEDQAEYLLEDRGADGYPRKYEKSINEFTKLAKELEKAFK
jgi:hypothetical protein